jgi:coiled-coil domain-containing protein 6
VLQVNLENQMEMEEENIVNRLTRQLEALSCSYRALEARLEARGLTLRDMGLAPHELPPECAPRCGRLNMASTQP